VRAFLFRYALFYRAFFRTSTVAAFRSNKRLAERQFMNIRYRELPDGERNLFQVLELDVFSFVQSALSSTMFLAVDTSSSGDSATSLAITVLV